MRRTHFAVGLLCLTASCVYFNAVYDVRNTYSEAVRFEREGNNSAARVRYDSVIAMTERIITNHPDSKYAVSASFMKARAEIARQLPEAAANTAMGIATLTDNERDLSTADGILGIARRQLGELPAADSTLSLALAGDIAGDDRAVFLFHRGMVRLEAGQPDLAAEDLAATGIQSELSIDRQLDLAQALSEVGQYVASARLTASLVRNNRFASFGQGLHMHLDSLARRAPMILDSTLAVELNASDPSDTKRSALYYFRAYSAERMSDTLTALARYDSARTWDERGRYGTSASYRSARLRILQSVVPSDIVGTQSSLALAATTSDRGLAVDARRLNERVTLFSNLVSAYESRGSTAAEAALRAAEVAGGDLNASRVARGLYLRYLELAPTSPWAAKAIFGALLYSDTPAGAWVDDRGLSTDDRLRAQLAALPETNPYRISIENLARDADADSSYVLAESDLQRRLIEIQMLYDTTAVILAPQDAAQPEEEQQPEPEADEDGVEF